MIDPGDSSVGLCWNGSQLPVARVGESHPRSLDALILFRESDTLFLLKDCRPNRISESMFCRIIDQSNNVELASFPIYKVLFCARGHDGTTESNCFAFTESSHGSEEFQIHVFSCEIKEAVSIIYCSNLLSR